MFHQSRLDPGDGVQQADVGGDVDDPQPGRREHHRDFRRPGEMGEQFGMPGIAVPGGVQRLLAERGGADGVGFSRHHQLAGALDVAEGGFARDGGDLPEGEVGGHQVQVDHLDRAVLEPRSCRAVHRADGEGRAYQGSRLEQPASIAHDQRPAHGIDLGMGQAAHDDFRTDAGRVAHGDEDDGARHGCFSFKC
jgi:hypothetical protein